MRYEWDEAKNRLNQRNHDGISLPLGALVFEDPYCIVYPERIDPETGEQRWHAIGDRGEEIIRIVSARPAEKYEISRYRQQEVD